MLLLSLCSRLNNSLFDFFLRNQKAIKHLNEIGVNNLQRCISTKVKTLQFTYVKKTQK